MRFRSFDRLRLFTIVARHDSFSAAAEEVNLTKGAVSYQMQRLEDAIGCPLFHREPRGIVLTGMGRELYRIARASFDDMERHIAAMKSPRGRTVTIGISTYLASRWLSSRLMTFMEDHAEIRLRLQPMIDLVDLQDSDVDLAIRWGKGQWSDLEVERLFSCPAFPTGAPVFAEEIVRDGIESVLARSTLFQDRDGSSAWEDWHRAAGLRYHKHDDLLTIPDPNVRVQAVIDGQGIALNDALVASEIEDGRLVRLSPVELGDYGYFVVYPQKSLDDTQVAAFVAWLRLQANQASGVV